MICAVWDHDWNHTYRKFVKDTDWSVSELMSIPVSQIFYLLSDSVEQTYTTTTKEQMEEIKQRIIARRKGQR